MCTCASFSQDTVLAFNVTTNGTVGLRTKYCPESDTEVMLQMTVCCFGCIQNWVILAMNM